ncbi:Acylphosphatase [Cyphellophora attinorum]|uniref:Acylphosphatase n=1 Tax=Cyphellophora attinorum TaxID=1664694 RepID=A0A0N0NLN1_9EURO|nr:Acylphosphatase [Phialophora attinorum]KPI39229.1 Acylphosphatase [Phialophora attinorum]
MSQRISFLVHGKVQGVFFRDFTQTKASDYGLTGWVRNTNDGKVEGEAQGDKAGLEKFKKDLNEGSKASHVVKVETKDIATKDGESEFRS